MYEVHGLTYVSIFNIEGVFIPEMLINICLLLFLVMLGPVCGHNVLKL